jgi:hypothetical protein
LGQLSPAWKKTLAVGSCATLAILGLTYLMSGHDGSPLSSNAPPTGTVGLQVLSGNRGDNSVEALAAAVQRMAAKQEELTRQLAEQHAALGAVRARETAAGSGKSSPPAQPPTELPTEPPTAGTLAGVAAATAKPPAGATTKASYATRLGPDASLPPVNAVPTGDQIAAALAPGNVWSGSSGWAGIPAGSGAGATSQASAGPVSTGAAAVSGTGVHVFRQDAAARPAVHTEGYELFDLPPGSILSGVLLTGVDAPTSSLAQRDPVPALMRIKQMTILPNLHEADQRECFALMSGYGNLSSERAEFRAEDLSCILADGSTFRTHLKGYAVDESGRLGVRGPVVSKQGSFIARSLVVGIMQGIAQAFGREQSYGIGVNQGQLSFQQAGDQTTGGAISGAGKGLDRIAQFYLDQAEGMFPVIEINAGRQVDLILTDEVKVKLPGETSQ